MLKSLISMVGAQPLPGAARIAGDYRLGLGGTQQDAARRHPLTCPTCRSSSAPASRAGAARGRGAGHLPDHHDHAVGAGAQVVRGHSFFGDSYVYVIFEDGTDLYWARARCPRIPQPGRFQTAGRHTAADRPGRHRGWLGVQLRAGRSQRQHDLASCAACRTGSSKHELQTVPGVSEVATVGGMVRQYQVVVDPEKLRAYGIA